MIFLAGMPVLIPLITALAVLSMVEDFGGVLTGVFTFIILFICFISMFISLGLDSTPGIEMIFASLPIKKTAIVRARYLSSSLFVLFNFSLVVLTVIAVKQSSDIPSHLVSIFLTGRGILCMAALFLLLISLILPFYFKYGPGRGVVAALLFQAGLALIVPAVKFVLHLFGGEIILDIGFIFDQLQLLLTWILSLRPFIAYILVIGSILFIVTFSTIISGYFYTKRDL